MTSLRQIAANRRNAQLSTGPKTEEGKLRVSGNAWRHGLAADGKSWQEREQAQLALRRDDWQNRLQPSDPTEQWLVGMIATETLRLQRCHEHESALMAEGAERAAHCWDDDQRVAVEQLATRLAKEPALVSNQLRQTSAGCKWLRQRWEALEKILSKTGGWTGSQVSLAYDLLGIAPVLREGSTALDPPADANPMEWIRGFIRAQIADLEQRCAGSLDTIDAHQRAHAEQGFFAEPARALTLVRRYEAACLRRLQWALGQFAEPRPASSGAPEVVPEAKAPQPPVERQCIDAADVSILPPRAEAPAASVASAPGATPPAEPADLLAEAFCDRVRGHYAHRGTARSRRDLSTAVPST